MLDKIIAVASEAYLDNAVEGAYLGGCVGDKLAEFIASELESVSDTSDSPSVAFSRAANAMRTAARELWDIARALEEECDRR